MHSATTYTSNPVKHDDSNPLRHDQDQKIGKDMMDLFVRTTKSLKRKTTNTNTTVSTAPSRPTPRYTQTSSAEPPPPPAYAQIQEPDDPSDLYIQTYSRNRSASSSVNQARHSSNTTSLLSQVSVAIPRTEEDDEQLPAYTARIPAAVPASCITTRSLNGKIRYRFSVHPDQVMWNPARKDAAPGPCVVQ